MPARGSAPPHQPRDRLAQFLSRSTVTVHLSHIYAKLNIRNRRELATLAAHKSASIPSANRKLGTRTLRLARWRPILHSGTIVCVAPTVLIVDDHGDFRASARAMLEAEGFRVIGEAGDGVAAMRVADSLAPDIVLLDIQLPGEDGFAVAERLAGAEHAPVVVLISSRDASVYGPRLTGAAAQGFIPKWALSGAALARLVG
jgi:DNA-binding NarL/FixJ family response regulator